MRNLRSLFHSNRNTAWQDDVQAKLKSLTESQDQIRNELAELVAAARPTPRGQQRAATFISAFLVLIVFAVTATNLSSTFKDRATTFHSAAQTADEQLTKDLQAIANTEKKYGAKYIIAH